jgi:hypothetical protein
MIIQRRYANYQRAKFSTLVEEQIERAIEKECIRYDVSRSFVIANALAFTFGIDIESYKDDKRIKNIAKPHRTAKILKLKLRKRA